MKSTKSLLTTILFVVCTLVFATSAQVSALPPGQVTPQSHRRGNQHPFEPQMASRTGSSGSQASARPMAASPGWSLPAPTTNVGFQAAPHISAGMAPSTGVDALPYLSALGDFNGDGKQDVAAVVQDPNSAYWLSILISNGDGTFKPPTLTAIAFGGNDLLAVGDLNRDGKADVVLVHSNSIDVLIGNGTGGFAAPVNYATSISNPVAVTLMDTNADTFVDVVVANGTPDISGNSPVTTLAGNGTGTLGTASTSHYSGTMNYGVLADLNADGHPDLVSATQVFLGTGSDYLPPVTLTSATNTCTYPFGIANGSVIVADVTGDGKPDILTADCSNHTITAFVNLGGGSFSAGASTWAGYLPETVTVADVNGDGKADVIVGDFYSMDIMVLLGNKDGTFAAPSLGYAVGGDLWTTPVVADFNADGHPDIVVPSGISDQWESLVYLAGLGNGAFVAPHDYFFAGGAPGTSADSWGIATADLNGDGLPDFVVGNLSTDTNVGVTVFLSNTASLSKALELGVNYGSGGNLKFVALADINGDGKPDLIASSADPTNGNIEVFLGNGDGTFQTPPTTISVTSSAGLGQLVVGDFNGDSKPDIAVLDTGAISGINQTFTGNVWILLNQSTLGVPSFASPVSYSLTSPGWELAAADLGNGSIDLVITQSQSTAVSILMGNGTGVFAAQPDFDLQSFYPAGLAIAQLDPSGSPDLIVTIDDSNAGMGIAVASGNGNGTFGTPVLYPATSKTTGTITPFPAEVRVADLNGDGNLDLVFTNFGDGAVGVLYGTGQWGSGQSPFYAPVEFAANDCPLTLVLADVNGDGALDAVIDGCGFSDVTTLLNIGSNQVSISSSANPSVTSQSVTFTGTVTAKPVPGGAINSPSGTVTFTEGGTVLGSGPVTLSGGQASVNASFSLQGTHVILATYSGDANFVGSTLATLVQNVNTSAVVSGYRLSATPTNASLRPGQSATFVVTATPNTVSFATVNFNCGSLPLGITCVFNPISLKLNGTAAASTTLTVSVAPTVVASNAPVSPNGSLPMAGAMIGIFGCVALGGLRRQARSKLTPALLLIALAVILAATGCGSTSSGTTPTLGVSPKTIHVMATSAGQTASQQINLTITVHQ
jgi:hypothetical protein